MRYHILIPVLFSVIPLSGCIPPDMRPSSSAEVAAIPNDCSNKKSIIRYLEEQSSPDKRPWGMSDKSWNIKRSYFRSKIWEIRTECQPSTY